jgi:hypothetical protein
MFLAFAVRRAPTLLRCACSVRKYNLTNDNCESDSRQDYVGADHGPFTSDQVGHRRGRDETDDSSDGVHTKDDTGPRGRSVVGTDTKVLLVIVDLMISQ